eukprot:CAMPEP_0114250740 /NCGR_PEP_ID=MMETSP0058-20121206/14869_1 /TAXON_ID=36894 /ORGANISM="Pyramimonas parkeae, CCMP726" /LENGTH=467 /DNA_ID=CAMNT_0001364437 /DNA_START=162 /DNA_END=1565 /DNA_ORIENTATION=+
MLQDFSAFTIKWVALYCVGLTNIYVSSFKLETPLVKGDHGIRTDPLYPETPISKDCRLKVQEFVAEQDLVDNAVKTDGEERLQFFLHVPRTGGRTLHKCFLIPATHPSRRCMPSYDSLRLNHSAPDCGLLSSHDDYSLVHSLPFKPAVFTSMRDPVERVLSAYEFVIQNAQKELMNEKKEARPKGSPDVAKKRMQGSKVNTLQVYPWSILVPLLQEKMQANQARRASLNFTELLFLDNKRDPYNSDLTVPLLEFIQHPSVASTIHNGAAFQLLGITAASSVENAAEIRQCAQTGDAVVVDQLFQLAKKRLLNLAFVGLQEEHQLTMQLYAAKEGLLLSRRAHSAPSKEVTKAMDYDLHDDDGDGDTDVDAIPGARKHADQVSIMEYYEKCVVKSLNKYSKQRSNVMTSLKWATGEPFLLNSMTRRSIQPSVTNELRHRNQLDIRLYSTAVSVFRERYAEYMRLNANF